MKRRRYKACPDDSSHYLIYHFDRKLIQLDFIFVDGNLNVLDAGSKSLKKEYKDDNYHWLECFADKNFNIYIHSNSRNSEGYNTSKLSKFTFNKDGKLEAKEQYDWNVSDKGIKYLHIHFGKGEEMIVAAIRKGQETLDGSEEKRDCAVGMSWTTINTLSGEKIREVYSPFDLNLLNDFFTKSEWDNSKRNGLFETLRPIQIVSNGGDGYYLICEERARYYRSDDCSYKFMSLLVCNIDKDGKLSWLSCVPKNQGFLGSYFPHEIDVYKKSKIEVSVGFLSISGAIDMRTYLSYTLLQKEEKLYFLFNDWTGNFGNSGEMNYLQFGFTYGIPTCAVVDKRGRATKKLLYSQKPKDLKMRTGLSYKTANGDHLIFSGKGKANKLGKVSLK